MTRVLVIAPHMDDEVLGCGGVIARHAAKGHHVHVCVCCHRVYDRTHDETANETERHATRKAKEILGYSELTFLDLPDETLHMSFQSLLDGLEGVVREFLPEIVFVPYAGDLHQDHRTVAHGANIALRTSTAPTVRRILAFEVPSGTEQSFPGTVPAFVPTVFVDIAPWLERKIEAMGAYERESRPFPHPRSTEVLRARAVVAGSVVGAAAAEAFVLLREAIP